MEIRPGRCRSWLDPEWSRARSAQLAAELTEKFQGRYAKLVTLTYDPANLHPGEDADPLLLYRRQQAERHVRRFIERLGDMLRKRGKVAGDGNPLTGKWLRKMEFHRSGLIHWHLVIDWGPAIPKDWIREAWGHGHTDIRRVDADGVRYVAKYVAKEQAFPSFLLGEPPRSVRIVAVSPGFWDRHRPKVARAPSPPKRSEYVPLGEVMRRRKHTTEVRESVDRRHTLRVPFAAVVAFLVGCGCGLASATETTWFSVTGDGAKRLADARAAAGGPGSAFSLSLIQDPPDNWWIGYDPPPNTVVANATGRAAA